MSTKISTKKTVICPECWKKGTLNLNHGTSYRVGHNYKDKKGEWKKRWHTIGTVKKDLKKLRNFSSKNDHIIDSKLVDDFDKLFSKNNSLDTQVDLLSLVNAIKEVGKKIDNEWINADDKKYRHKLVKGLNCPHCKREIQIRYDRLGPSGKALEINQIGKGIERRSSGHTSRFIDGKVEKGS